MESERRYIDIKKAFEAAKPSIAVLAITLLAQVGLNTFILKEDLIQDVISIFFYIVNLSLYMYAGYRATKVLGQDILTAGTAGALAALTIGVFYGIILIPTFAFLLATDMVPVSQSVLGEFGGELGVSAIIISMGLACELVVTIISIAVNFVTAAVGGFIGQRLK